MSRIMSAGNKFSVLLILSLLCSCSLTKEIQEGVVYVKTKKYTGYIWNENYPLQYNTDEIRWNPTPHDIKKAEWIFRNYINIFKPDSLAICMEVLEDIKRESNSCYRQYWGVFDKNGDKIIVVNAYHPKEIIDNKKYFETHFYHIAAICPFHWYVEINLDKRRCFGFGYGG